MNHRARIPALLLVLTLLLGCAGCGDGREPVTVTIWHVYGGETESPLNDLIDTFNETVGRTQNIRVQVGSVTNTNTIHEAVLASAYGEPGATALPDMFVSYPKTVLALPDADILVDYRDYFSDAELDDFIPAFLDEGEVNGHLTVLPVAKSTEILFVDKTLFDRFAAATGATLDDLSTWEGLYRTAEAYTAWTDAQTPDTPDDGKVFFVHDYHFNYFQVGVESLGADFFDGDQVAFGPAFRRVWEPYARATLAGSVWLKSGYATEPLRTGDAVASVASSASVLYYADTVTYPDNTSEPVEIISLPCPTFADGDHWAHEGIDYCIANGLMSGIGNDLFGPKLTTTRAQIVQILYNLEGEPKVSGTTPFTDLTNDWYQDAVLWAYQTGVVAGTSSTTFEPDRPVTREQIAVILMEYVTRVLKLERTWTPADLSIFPDAGSVSDWAKDAMADAVALGLISGASNGGQTYLEPQGSATREQVATILMEFCKNVKK